MCVSQFREYCNASRFKHENREADLKDKNYKVRKETYRYADRSYYYVTDLVELKRLAKKGNPYAQSELQQRSNI